MRKKKQSLSSYLLFSLEIFSEMSCQRSCWSDLLYFTDTFLHSVWLMTPSRPNKCLHILGKCLFAFTFCSFLHIHPPLAGVEFNGLVLSDLQILDYQGRLPRGRASFLGPSSSKPNFLGACCVHLMINTVDSSLKSQRVLLSHRKTPSLCLVCWPCGLFSERVGFKQHIF